jgi:xanthine dehydrogenase YagS FAD-binding subunit
VGTPQIRNVATLAGNVTQRPWCWYYRNGFDCFKAGGNQCFSVNGENQQHAIFGGGPSFIVHPSDLAPALVALHATFEVTGPGRQHRISAADFFVLPSQNPARENALVATELLTGVRIPTPAAGVVSTYLKITDREAWTHAEVSVAVVLHVDGDRIRTASVVLGGVAPIPWRLTEVENFLSGTSLSAAVAGQAGALAIANARPLAKNGHKLPMTSAAVERALMRLAPA